MAKIIYTDITKCMGCKNCELACAVAHSQSKNLLSSLVEELKPRSRVKVVSINNTPVPIQCMHCEDAPCIQICPTKAITRAPGQDHIIFNADLCIGCHSCVLVCPFGAARQQGKQIIRCDLCIDRLEEGEEPACIVACPVHCRFITTAEEVAEKRRKEAAQEIKKGAEKII